MNRIVYNGKSKLSDELELKLATVFGQVLSYG